MQVPYRRSSYFHIDLLLVLGEPFQFNCQIRSRRVSTFQSCYLERDSLSDLRRSEGRKKSRVEPSSLTGSFHSRDHISVFL